MFDWTCWFRCWDDVAGTCSFVVEAVGNGGELSGGYDYSVGGAVGEVESNVGGLTGGDVEDDVGDDIGDGLTGDVADNIS